MYHWVTTPLPVSVYADFEPAYELLVDVLHRSKRLREFRNGMLAKPRMIDRNALLARFAEVHFTRLVSASKLTPEPLYAAQGGTISKMGVPHYVVEFVDRSHMRLGFSELDHAVMFRLTLS